jgi:hypothetical protein
MKKVEEKIILFDAKDLVEYRTDLEGWTGPDRLYYGKGEEGENRARQANSTHQRHHCGNIIRKNSYCPTCSEQNSREYFLKLEEVEWDGKSMMSLRHDDRFFSDMEEVFEYCDDNDIDIEDLKLMECEKRVDISEINIDELNEEYCTNDGELGVSHYHPEIAKKVDELNELIRNAEPVLWFETKKRIKISEKDLIDYKTR